MKPEPPVTSTTLLAQSGGDAPSPADAPSLFDTGPFVSTDTNSRSDPQMSDSSPTVAGLVLNYNGRDVTQLSLSSLVELDYPNLELVVVDNGSTDDSFAAISAAYPTIRQLRVRENHGISWGLNHGIQWALDEGFDYVLLMNNDIEVAPDMLSELITVAESQPTIGCVGPKTYYYSDRERLWSTGGQLHFRHSLTDERGDGELDRGQYEQDQAMQYINGCAMLVKAKAMQAAGYWDPDYYLGLEDADFCVRLKAAGFSCWYAHRAKLWHMISHSIGVYKPTRTFHTTRSQGIFLRKHATSFQRLSSLLWFAAAMPIAYVRELFKGNQEAVVQKVRGLRAGLNAPLSVLPIEYRDLIE